MVNLLGYRFDAGEHCIKHSLEKYPILGKPSMFKEILKDSRGADIEEVYLEDYDSDEDYKKACDECGKLLIAEICEHHDWVRIYSEFDLSKIPMDADITIPIKCSICEIKGYEIFTFDDAKFNK